MEKITIEIPINYLIEIALCANDPVPIEIQGFAKSKLYETNNYDKLLDRQSEKLNDVVENIRRIAGDEAADRVLETLEQNKEIYQRIESEYITQAGKEKRDVQQ